MKHSTEGGDEQDEVTGDSLWWRGTVPRLSSPWVWTPVVGLCLSNRIHAPHVGGAPDDECPWYLTLPHTVVTSSVTARSDPREIIAVTAEVTQFPG